MSLSDELDRLHSQFTQARIRLMHFVALANLAIDDHARSASTTISQLRSTLYASKQHQVIPALPAPDGSIEMPSMEELATRLQTLEYQAENISPHFPVLMHRMAFVQLVAHFEAFLSDVFEAVMVAQPNTLKSKEKKLDYETILNHSSIGQLVRYLAKRELHDVGYKSVQDQARYYHDRFGVDLDGVDLDDAGVGIDRLVEIYAIRNLFLHNDGIVNEIFLKLVPSSLYKSGDVIEITTEVWLHAFTALERLARHVVQELSKKHAKAEDQAEKT